MAKYIDMEKLLELIDKALLESPVDGDEQIGILKCRKIIRECPAETIEMPEVYFECDRKQCEVCNPRCHMTTQLGHAKNFESITHRDKRMIVEVTKDDMEAFREQRTFHNMFRLMDLLKSEDIVRMIMTSKTAETAVRTVALEDEIRILAGNDFVIDLRPLAERLADIDAENTDYNTWLDHVWRRLREGITPEAVVKDLQYLLDKSIEKITEEMKDG